jgi:hypothetical protein
VKNRDRLMRELATSPRNATVDERKAMFADINTYVNARSGWTTSIPGDVEVRFECLADSPLQDELRSGAAFKQAGRTVRLPKYDVVADGETSRILPHAIVERFSRRADGTLGLLTADSTAAVAETRTHAGIAKVLRYSFTIP